MRKIDSVLFPTDLSEISAHVVPDALELCKLYGATLHVLHVIEADAFVAMYGRSLDSIPNVEERIRENAEEQLKAFVERFSEISPQSAVRAGNAADVICEYAAEMHAGLIIMATHGRTGLPHLLLGSVTERVIRMAPLPVLVLKDPGRIASPLNAC